MANCRQCGEPVFTSDWDGFPPEMACRGALGFFKPDIDLAALRPLGSVIEQSDAGPENG